MMSRLHGEAKDLYFQSRVQIVKCLEFWKREVGSGKRERVASGYVGEEEARERSKDYEEMECKVPILRAPQVVSGRTAVWMKELVMRTWVCEVVVGGFLPSSSSCSDEESSGSDGGDRGRDIAILSSMTWWTCSDDFKERVCRMSFIMWVGWREDRSGKKIAYREGLGRVERRA
jgi:hypothetical protein